VLKISKLADYASVLMCFLSQNHTNAYSATALADHTRIPLPTVSKILKRLNDGRLLISTRGVNGGYRLARPAEEINVAQIIAAIDGLPALTECCTSDSKCTRDQHCALRGNWRRINQLVVGVLANVSLQSMHEPLTTEVSVRLPNKANGRTVQYVE